MNRESAQILPPGEFLREELEERGWAQSDLAEILRLPAKLVSEVISGKRAITSEIAMGLGEAFGTSAQYWSNLERAYRNVQAATSSPRWDQLP